MCTDTAGTRPCHAHCDALEAVESAIRRRGWTIAAGWSGEKGHAHQVGRMTRLRLCRDLRDHDLRVPVEQRGQHGGQDQRDRATGSRGRCARHTAMDDGNHAPVDREAESGGGEGVNLDLQVPFGAERQDAWCGPRLLQDLCAHACPGRRCRRTAWYSCTTSSRWRRAPWPSRSKSLRCPRCGVRAWAGPGWDPIVRSAKRLEAFESRGERGSPGLAATCRPYRAAVSIARLPARRRAVPADGLPRRCQGGVPELGRLLTTSSRSSGRSRRERPGDRRRVRGSRGPSCRVGTCRGARGRAAPAVALVGLLTPT